jgi:hypothetical protein
MTTALHDEVGKGGGLIETVTLTYGSLSRQRQSAEGYGRDGGLKAIRFGCRRISADSC